MVVIPKTTDFYRSSKQHSCDTTQCSLYILFSTDPFLLSNCDVHKSVLCLMHINMSAHQNQTHFHSPTWHYQKGVGLEREELGQTPATKTLSPQQELKSIL